MNAATEPIGSRFETKFRVQPAEVDMFRHVHNSHYFDYVLAARYDQMERCYGVSMERFMELGFGWVVRTAHLEFKRPLNLGDRFRVGTQVVSIHQSDVQVRFDIRQEENAKIACDGWFLYSMVNLETGRAHPIPDWIVDKYSV